MYGSTYSWSCGDALRLLGVRFNDSKEEAMIPCPFCGGKRFAMNIRKGTGHCFSAGCCKTADSASYYAAAQGISVIEARTEIKNRLNIRDEEGKLPERFVFKEVEASDLAPVEIRDVTYRAFLEELVLSKKNTDNLLARGFSIDDIVYKGYKTFPSVSEVSFEDICRRLQMKGYILKGVPGFFKNKRGEWTFIRMTKGILIPQVNCQNQIEGFQIRKDDDLRQNLETGELEPKIVWFSSKNCPEGTGAKTSVHIATDFLYNKESKKYEPILHGNTVTLTEGAMKADLCQSLLDNKVSFIAIQGIHSLNPLKKTLTELKEYGLKRVNIAFDMDYLTNSNVANAMKKVEQLIKELGLQYENIMNWEYEIKKGDTSFFLKGLDDFLAYQYKHVVPITITRNE